MKKDIYFVRHSERGVHTGQMFVLASSEEGAVKEYKKVFPCVLRKVIRATNVQHIHRNAKLDLVCEVSHQLNVLHRSMNALRKSGVGVLK